MNCPNCGAVNNPGSKFCIRCGTNIEGVQVQTEQPSQVGTATQQPVNQNINPVPSQVTNASVNQNTSNVQVSPNSSQNNQTINNQTTSSTNKISIVQYFFIIMSVILKPFTAFKEELKKFDVFKNSMIMSLIVSGVSTLINLITTMLNAIIVKSYSWSSGKYTTTWVWENLKDLNYVEIIFKNFLIYLGVIFAIAVVYYLASLVVKKQTNFARLLGIYSLVVTPVLICSLLLAPILSLIWAELAMPVIIIGLIYTIILLYENMNNEILLEGNVKYYFNLVCLSILAVVIYFLYMKLVIGPATDGLEEIFDLFS